MYISFVIVNRNTKEILLDCIKSIYATVPPLTFEILLVDNGSSDGSLDSVREAFPEVVCLANDRNLGFAKANNQAIRRAAGTYLVLLNTDTVLTDSAIADITSFMDAHPEVAICGGQLLNSDGTLQNSIANYPTLATELLNKSILRRLFPQRYPGKEARFDSPVDVESIIGACMVVSKRAVEQVGMLDEDFFFFFEETAWCLEMKRHGWRVMFHPTARIYHLQGGTARRVNIAARVEYWRSRSCYFRKYHSPVAGLLLGCGLLVKLCGSLLLQMFAFPLSSKARNRLKVNAALLAWHLRGCPVGWGLTGDLMTNDSPGS